MVTFSTGQSTKTFSIPTTEDNAAEPTELFVVAISGLVASEATIDSETTAEFHIFGVPAWVALILDDDTKPTVSITGGSAVTEGSKAEFTVSAAQEVASDLTVQLTVADAGGSDFIASGDEGSKSVVIAKGDRSATYEVQTQGDTTDEPNADISVAIASNAAYTTGSPSSATVRVNDDDGGTANNAPTVANQIPNQTATAGTAFSYAFLANTFSDADSDSLTYTATKSDDTALPSWLTFTAVTRTFSGTPQAANVGTLSVKVTANDGNSGTVSDTFDIVVSAADTTAPGVTSIERQTPNSSPTNADSVKWRVTFNEAVQNVDAGDFQVSGTALTITVVSPVTGSETTTYDVTVSSGNLAGLDATVTLSFASGHNIQDMAGNALASSPSVSGTNDNSYVVDNTAPGVTSITRQTPNPSLTFSR